MAGSTWALHSGLLVLVSFSLTGTTKIGATAAVVVEEDSIMEDEDIVDEGAEKILEVGCIEVRLCTM
jgi:hypothetical protein